MSELIPGWARSKAAKLAAETTPSGSPLSAFAAYIAAHEEPPVDQCLLEARNIVATWYEDNPPKHTSISPRAIRDGQIDSSTEVKQALRAIKRGMEIITPEDSLSIAETYREIHGAGVSMTINGLRKAGFSIIKNPEGATT